MSEYTVDATTVKIPPNRKQIRFSITLKDGDIMIVIVCEPKNAVQIGELLIKAGRDADRLIDMPSRLPSEIKLK